MFVGRTLATLPDVGVPAVPGVLLIFMPAVGLGISSSPHTAAAAAEKSATDVRPVGPPFTATALPDWRDASARAFAVMVTLCVDSRMVGGVGRARFWSSGRVDNSARAGAHHHESVRPTAAARPAAGCQRERVAMCFELAALPATHHSRICSANFIS